MFADKSAYFVIIFSTHRRQVYFSSNNGLIWYVFLFFEQKKTILFEAKHFCFLFLLVRFILSKIDFWSSKLPERLRGWSAFQYVLRAWFRNPFLSSNNLETPELNSVGTKKGVHKFVKKITKKFVRSQNFEVRIGSQTLEVRLSRLVNQTSDENFKDCSWRKSDGQCYTFFYWNHSSMEFWKTSG